MALLTSRDIRLGGLAGLLGNLSERSRPAGLTFEKSMRESSRLLASEAKDCFSGSHDPDGNAWLPLKWLRKRLRDKRAKGGTGQKPLVDKGLLMASMSAAAATRGSIRDIGPTHLEQGSNLDYAAIHNFGGTIHKPARTALKDQRGRFTSLRKAARRPTTLREATISAHTVTIPARPFAGITDRALDKIELFVADDMVRQLGA